MREPVVGDAEEYQQQGSATLAAPAGWLWLVQEALQLLQAAILAAPTSAEAYNNLGVLQVSVYEGWL